MYRSVIVNALRSFNDGIFCSNYVRIDIYYLVELPARLGRAASAAHAYVRTSLDYIGLLLPGPATWQYLKSAGTPQIKILAPVNCIR